MIRAMEQALLDEEAEDLALRTSYGPKFSRMPSTTVNGAYKQSILDYKNKIQQANISDQ